MLSAAKHSVLVVDDDCAIVKMLGQNLAESKFQIMTATNGCECVRVLCQASVDLVLLDIKLPDFSGWGILSLLRLTEAMCHIPVIIISAEPPNRAMLEQFKPNDYIQKPFDMCDLLVRVERVVDAECRGVDSEIICPG